MQTMKKILLVAVAVMLAATSVSAQAQKQQKVAAPKILRVPHDFKSIQRALDEAEPGDTVFVDEGTYKESVVLRDDIVLTGVSAERTIIHGTRRNPVIRGAQGATIRNVTIEGGQMGILAANTMMTIENCVIRSNRGSGIHCLIALPVIRNNIVFRNAWSGIYLETTRSHKGHISNNIIAENSYSGVMLAGQSEALIENNVFYFNKQYGVFTAEGARKSRITGNSFYGNRQSGNSFSLIDKTNFHNDPGYTVFDATGYMFWDRTPDMLKGRGRAGGDIGAVRAQPYRLREKTQSAKPAKVAAPTAKDQKPKSDAATKTAPATKEAATTNEAPVSAPASAPAPVTPPSAEASRAQSAPAPAASVEGSEKSSVEATPAPAQAPEPTSAKPEETADAAKDGKTEDAKPDTAEEISKPEATEVPK